MRGKKGKFFKLQADELSAEFAFRKIFTNT